MREHRDRGWSADRFPGSRWWPSGRAQSDRNRGLLRPSWSPFPRVGIPRLAPRRVTGAGPGRPGVSWTTDARLPATRSAARCASSWPPPGGIACSRRNGATPLAPRRSPGAVPRGAAVSLALRGEPRGAAKWGEGSWLRCVRTPRAEARVSWSTGPKTGRPGGSTPEPPSPSGYRRRGGGGYLPWRPMGHQPSKGFSNVKDRSEIGRAHV